MDLQKTRSLYREAAEKLLQKLNGLRESTVKNREEAVKCIQMLSNLQGQLFNLNYKISLAVDIDKIEEEIFSADDYMLDLGIKVRRLRSHYMYYEEKSDRYEDQTQNIQYILSMLGLKELPEIDETVRIEPQLQAKFISDRKDVRPIIKRRIVCKVTYRRVYRREFKHKNKTETTHKMGGANKMSKFKIRRSSFYEYSEIIIHRNESATVTVHSCTCKLFLWYYRPALRNTIVICTLFRDSGG